MEQAEATIDALLYPSYTYQTHPRFLMRREPIQRFPCGQARTLIQAHGCKGFDPCGFFLVCQEDAGKTYRNHLPMHHNLPTSALTELNPQAG